MSEPEKKDSIRNMDPSQNVRDVRRLLRLTILLGMVNPLGKFIPHLAEKTKPSRDLLCPKNEFLWGPTQKNACKKLKQLLTSNPVLAYNDPTEKPILSVDASSYGLGAVLLNEENGIKKPIAMHLS